MTTNSLQLVPTGEQFVWPHNWNERNRALLPHNGHQKTETLESSAGLFSCLSQACCMALFRCQYNNFNRATSTITPNVQTMCGWYKNLSMWSDLAVKEAGKARRVLFRAATRFITFLMHHITSHWVISIVFDCSSEWACICRSPSYFTKCDMLVYILHRHLMSFQNNTLI